jgi:hypothetical protein
MSALLLAGVPGGWPPGNAGIDPGRLPEPSQDVIRQGISGKPGARVREARGQFKAGNLGAALRSYESLLASTPHTDRNRSEALYWAGMLRMSPDPKLRDLDRARAWLGELQVFYPQWERQYEATVALALTEELASTRASAEAQRARVQRSSESCLSEKEQMAAMTKSAQDEAASLRAELEARSAEIQGLKEDLKRKDAALRKVKEVLVDWKAPH